MLRSALLAAVVSFHGFVPRRVALHALANADAGLVLLGSGPGMGVFVSGKLYDYIGHSKQVLAMVPAGDARDLLAKLGWGVIADPEPASVANAIELLLAAPLPVVQADPEGRYDRAVSPGRLLIPSPALPGHQRHGARRQHPVVLVKLAHCGRQQNASDDGIWTRGHAAALQSGFWKRSNARFLASQLRLARQPCSVTTRSTLTRRWAGWHEPRTPTLTGRSYAFRLRRGGELRIRRRPGTSSRRFCPWRIAQATHPTMRERSAARASCWAFSFQAVRSRLARWPRRNNPRRSSTPVRSSMV